MNYRSAEIKDIPGILLLEKKYHKNSISKEDKPGGCIGTFFSEKKLKRLIEEEKGLAVAYDGDRMIGFANSASWRFWQEWPVFHPMIDDLPNIKYKDRVLSADNSYQYGPACIDKDYRGTGVLFNLFECSRLLMKDRYPVLVTYVDQSNQRSFQAHSRKLGCDVVKEFEFHGDKLFVLCYDTSKKTRRTIK
ncbi:GNAT family acetyltransferase [Sedimentibacter hydroxybenzoicus DSM 7310]|uniref:GNAT family acetyltransferase n=1 Tax=Sedimentibacter hydroxybenzoicus DSM 7310 TaxID=1123245 RepID=A0A974BLI2_SEDHY|nr:GNAT family acetyltransferase [Sedimentibacter hydroxybenzoicus]NYB75378.1 GNAT family acetyltransferase [Sedimentibacter hydroxybenzoicus DSM 7310]